MATLICKQEQIELRQRLAAIGGQTRPIDRREAKEER